MPDPLICRSSMLRQGGFVSKVYRGMLRSNEFPKMNDYHEPPIATPNFYNNRRIILAMLPTIGTFMPKLATAEQTDYDSYAGECCRLSLWLVFRYFDIIENVHLAHPESIFLDKIRVLITTYKVFTVQTSMIV
jgi:hypothetical protein